MVSRISGESHGEVATPQDELKQVVPTVDGASEDVVLGKFHDMDMGDRVGEVATPKIRAF